MSIFNFFKKKERRAEIQASDIESPKPSVPEARPETQCTPESDAMASTPEGKKRVHNLIILDESGSMSSIYQPALTGLNETLQTIRGAQDEYMDQEHYVTLVAFNSLYYNQIYAHVPASMATDITVEQYRPSGCTPLFDAMGRSLIELRPLVAKEDIALVTVITDGYENASTEFDGKAIKALVESLKSQGWVFTYIGANQDVEAVADSISIDNYMEFETSEECTEAMFERERRSRRRFMDNLSRDMPMRDLSKGYFDEVGEEENRR